MMIQYATMALKGTDLSDGRWEIYSAQKAVYQPIEEIPAESYLELNTDSPMEQLARVSERFLRSRLEQN